MVNDAIAPLPPPPVAEGYDEEGCRATYLYDLPADLVHSLGVLLPRLKALTKAAHEARRPASLSELELHALAVAADMRHVHRHLAAIAEEPELAELSPRELELARRVQDLLADFGRVRAHLEARLPQAPEACEELTGG